MPPKAIRLLIKHSPGVDLIVSFSFVVAELNREFIGCLFFIPLLADVTLGDRVVSVKWIGININNSREVLLDLGGVEIVETISSDARK